MLMDEELGKSLEEILLGCVSLLVGNRDFKRDDKRLVASRGMVEVDSMTSFLFILYHVYALIDVTLYNYLKLINTI